MDNWLNLGISGGCCWPKKEQVIPFGGFELLLKPATKNTEQSVHINLSKGISWIDAMTLVNRFLSIISWCDGNNKGMDIIEGLGGSGSPVPIGIPIRARNIGSSFAFPFYRDIEKDSKKNLALALYREGLVTDSVALSFLSLFKIINIFYNDKRKVKTKKNDLIEGLRNLLPFIKDKLAQQRLQELQKTISDIPDYLYRRRCAIAHAFISPTIDPDSVSDSRDLSQDTWVVRAVADYLIENKLRISKSITG